MRLLFKKAIELSRLCSQNIAILVHDEALNKLSMYCSGSESHDTVFTMEKAIQVYRVFEDGPPTVGKKQQKRIKTFTDDDYDTLDSDKFNVKKNRDKQLPKKRGRPRKHEP